MNANGFALVARAESISISVAATISEFTANSRSLVVVELGERASARALVDRQMANICAIYIIPSD